jgi:hypothetical protein
LVELLLRFVDEGIDGLIVGLRLKHENC